MHASLTNPLLYSLGYFIVAFLPAAAIRLRAITFPYITGVCRYEASANGTSNI